MLKDLFSLYSQMVTIDTLPPIKCGLNFIRIGKQPLNVRT